MSFAIVFSAFGAFALLFVLQMLVSRLFTPRSEDKFIIAHFVILPMLIFGLLLALAWFHALPSVSPFDLTLSYLLFFVLSSSWVASYPAIYASCPTLIVSYIISHRTSGTQTNDFHRWLRLKGNSMERIDDALSGGLIEADGPNVRLSKSGKFLFLFFQTYKRILGLKSETL